MDLNRQDAKTPRSSGRHPPLGVLASWRFQIIIAITLVTSPALGQDRFEKEVVAERRDPQFLSKQLAILRDSAAS
ncbi:MAG: hypothetical protein ACAI25_20885, partial [Planctomycetota bacterium]